MVEGRRHFQQRPIVAVICRFDANEKAPVLVVSVGIADQGIQDQIAGQQTQDSIADRARTEEPLHRGDHVGERMVALVQALVALVADDLPGQDLVPVEEAHVGFGCERARCAAAVARELRQLDACAPDADDMGDFSGDFLGPIFAGIGSRFLE